MKAVLFTIVLSLSFTALSEEETKRKVMRSQEETVVIDAKG